MCGQEHRRQHPVRAGPDRLDYQAAQSVRATIRQHEGRASSDDLELLVGGCWPDALLIANHPTVQAVRDAWPLLGTYHGEPDGLDVAAALEFELSPKAGASMTDKIRRHRAAHAAGWWSATLWIVGDPRVWTVVRRTIEEVYGRSWDETPVGYVVPSWTVGLGGDPAIDLPCRWPHAAALGLLKERDTTTNSLSGLFS